MTRQTDAYFSTVSMLILYDEAENTQAFADCWAHVKQILGEIDSAVSLSSPDSDVSRFNALAAGEALAIRPLTAQILSHAFDVFHLTGGLYDPTVYPLVDLWGFSPRFNQSSYSAVMPYDRAYEDGLLPLPEDRYIQALLPLVGLDGLRLYQQDGVWYLEKNTPPVTVDGLTIQAQIDLGGAAKGFACDLVADYLRSAGYTSGHFVCGSSSMAILSRPTDDGRYTLALGKPRAGQSADTHYASVLVRDVSLSTSSDSTHAHVRGGVRYCHIIDPRTGYPVNMPQDGVQRGACSVTLLAPSAARSDALTTALFLMTPQQAAAFISEYLPGALAVLAYYSSDADTLEVMTNAQGGVFSLDDPAYRLSSSLTGGEMRYTGAFFSAP